MYISNAVNPAEGMLLSILPRLGGALVRSDSLSCKETIFLLIINCQLKKNKHEIVLINER